jgi:thioredoxin 1
MKTIAINETTFETEVLQSDKPTLVDLWAPWCGPCRLIAPLVDEIAEENGERFKIAKLNIDDNPQIAQRFDVRSIPTLLFFKDGELRDQVVGTVPKSTLLARLEALAA